MANLKNILIRSCVVALTLLTEEVTNKLGLPLILFSNAQGIAANDWFNDWKNDMLGEWEKDFLSEIEKDWPRGWKKDVLNSFHNSFQNIFQNSFQNNFQNNFQNSFQKSWLGGIKNDMLSDSINVILAHASKKNRQIINEHINELLSGRYNEVNPKSLLHRISNIIKNGKAESLCDDNKSFIIIGMPHLIFGSDLLNDLKIETINFLIRNITKNLDSCNLQVQGSDEPDITDGCQSEMDKEIIFDKEKPDGVVHSNGLYLSPSNKFFSSLLQCSVDSLGSGERTMICVQEQLAKRDLKLSDTCSACFKQSVDCGKSNCWLPCLFGNPCTQRCYNCATSSCNQDLIRCSGLQNLPGACS
ncbi:hypothetical protein C922_00041 [Plasmodium inui San Antonio 1]|uniref:Uncharacterized protein n=1 Tax=Plasmodium inui San Antonio 1 TaxID=1237626 RepID=W7ACY7_9APIC|nr:hypothetical protein C922_00041 [Plasmodium inui San Antonio 1]EUD69178.1 hypothetical protein C922_00041 [Plasmodium inui San Antonio 1]